MKRLKNVCCFYAMTIAVIIYCISGASYAEQSRGFKVVFKNKAGDDVGFYSGNHALLVGVSDYTDGWPDLESIPGELEKIKNLCTSSKTFSDNSNINIIMAIYISSTPIKITSKIIGKTSVIWLKSDDK